MVALGRSYAHLIALNGSLNFLELGVLDRGSDFLGGVTVQGERKRDDLLYSIAPRWFDFAGIEILDRDAALNELRLKHVPQRVHLVVVLGGKHDLAAGSIELYCRGRSFEIVALRDLFLRLIYGIVDFLE